MTNNTLSTLLDIAYEIGAWAVIVGAGIVTARAYLRRHPEYRNGK